MSIWSELLFLHGHLTRAPEAAGAAERTAPADPDEADRLRELIGCRSSSVSRPEPRGPVLGVKGLA